LIRAPKQAIISSGAHLARFSRENDMGWLHIILMLAGGILGVSGLIVAKKPDAKALIEKLVPFQAFIGVGLLAMGIWALLQIGPINMFKVIKVMPIISLTAIASSYGSILLGFLFGMPQIAKWIPGESAAETKAAELSKKLAPYQLILGAIVLGAGVLALLLQLGIMKPY
jgi:multisubunit Na+/H+ antiporter MnhC subunit